MACQVQLIGSRQVFFKSPTMDTKHAVKRNLFGAPEPGSINQALEEHNKAIRSHMLECYNFAMDKEDDCEDPNCQNLPPLIAEEMKMFEEKLNREKCKSSRANDSNVDSGNDNDDEDVIPLPQNNRITTESASNDNADNSHTVGSRSSGSICERRKPYTKQKEITDCFNVRKTTREKGRTAKSTMQVLPVVLKKQIDSSPLVSISYNGSCCELEATDSGTLSLQILAELSALKQTTSLTTISKSTSTLSPPSSASSLSSRSSSSASSTSLTSSSSPPTSSSQ